MSLYVYNICMYILFKKTCLIDEEEHMGLIKETGKELSAKPDSRRKVSIRVDQADSSHLTIPEAIAGSSSAETSTGKYIKIKNIYQRIV